MKGTGLTVEVLWLCMKPRSCRDVFEAIGCDERVIRVLMWELNESGLLQRVGHRKPTNGGNEAVLYRTSFVEGEVRGRVQTRAFICLWNALLEPDSVENIAIDTGQCRQTARRRIKMLYDAKLCHIASWQRNPISVPTAIYQLGRGKDAYRPQPMSMVEYNQRARQYRKKRLISVALFGQVAPIPKEAA